MILSLLALILLVIAVSFITHISYSVYYGYHFNITLLISLFRVILLKNTHIHIVFFHENITTLSSSHIKTFQEGMNSFNKLQLITIQEVSPVIQLKVLHRCFILLLVSLSYHYQFSWLLLRYPWSSYPYRTVVTEAGWPGTCPGESSHTIKVNCGKEWFINWSRRRREESWNSYIISRWSSNESNRS